MLRQHALSVTLADYGTHGAPCSPTPAHLRTFLPRALLRVCHVHEHEENEMPVRVVQLREAALEPHDDASTLHRV